MKKIVLTVLILLLLALTFPSIPSTPKVSATTTEDLRRVTPALPDDVPREPMPENFTTEDYLNTTNPYSNLAGAQGALDEVDDAEGNHPLYVLVFGDEEERGVIRHVGPEGQYPVIWETWAKLQLERGDEALVANFGIDIRILGFLEWDSDDSIEYMDDPYGWDLCDELLADKGHYLRTWYDGEWWSNYVDAIIGLTAQSTPADDPPAAGIAPSLNELNQGIIFVLLKWQVHWMDDNLVQHEVSHLYHAPDHPEPQPPAPCCAMAYHPHFQWWIAEDGLWWIFDNVGCSKTTYSWCTDCHQTIQQKSGKYPLRTLTISASSGGATNPIPGTYIYGNGSSVTVTATAYTHYVFDYWLLDQATVYGNPITVTMDADHNLEAYFKWVNSLPNTPSRPFGPPSGYRNVWYTYSTNATDPDGDNVRYQFEFTGPSLNLAFTTDWYASGQNGNLTVMWETTDPPGTYYVRARAQDVYEEWSNWSPYLTVNIVNRAPNTPSTPLGSPSGYNGTSYGYSTNTTDPDGDSVYYLFDWGDGSTTTVGPYASGSTVSFHTWGSAGTYYVKVKAKDVYDAWSGYSSSLTVTISNRSGGPGCPTLFVWNGNGYVDYGVINIHNPTGEDVIREVPIQSEDVRINSHKAKFRLREGWLGLNFSESVIDQVKLYAIGNDGNRYLCPLISAKHSSLGNVLPQLLLSDDYRAQMLLLETVDLTFAVQWQNIQGFTFAIEGCNFYKM